MALRTYHITLEGTIYVYKDFKIADSKESCTIATEYDPEYKGFRCGTEPPPCKTLYITDDEELITSIKIISKQMLEIKVQYVLKPNELSVHFFKL